MSKATRLIKHLNKIINDHNNFGDNPESFLDTIYEELNIDLEKLKEKNNPEHLAEIYVERDRAIIKQQILNRVMDECSPWFLRWTISCEQIRGQATEGHGDIFWSKYFRGFTVGQNSFVNQHHKITKISYMA